MAFHYKIDIKKTNKKSNKKKQAKTKIPNYAK